MTWAMRALHGSGAEPWDGFYMLRHTGICCPNGLLFHLKSLKHGSHFGQKKKKKKLRRGSISQKLQKLVIVKSAVFEVKKKILRNGSRFAKIRKNIKKKKKKKKKKHNTKTKKQNSEIRRFVLFCFLRKILWYGQGFQIHTLGCTLCPKIIWVFPPPGPNWKTE